MSTRPVSQRPLVPLAVAATAAAGLAVPLGTAAAAPDASGLVISEAYGGGGNNGAVYTHDFIELHNPTDQPISVDGMSVQYRAAGGTGAGQVTPLSGSVPAGGHYLIQQAQGAGGTTPLPTPDAVGTILMGGSGFQVWLAEGTEPLTPPAGSVAGTPGVVDFVGAGSASAYEGDGPAPAPSNTNAVTRDAEGTDTDQNAADLTAALPTPGAPASEPEPPEELALTIPEIQGTGMVSPHVGAVATTSGVVTAAYPDGGLYGFYLQTPGTGGAEDPATREASDGIFVRMTQPAGAVTVAPGDHVEVRGTVSEYAGQTQLEVAAAADVVPLDEPAEPVVAVTGDWPGTDAEKEALEGMLYLPTGDFTVSNTYSTGDFGEVGLAQGDRPLIQPTEVEDAQTGDVAAVEADNAARAIVLDDGSSWRFSGNDYDGSSTPPYVSLDEPVVVGAGVIFTEPVILTEGGSASAPTYRFQPTVQVVGPDNEGSPARFEDVRTDAPDQARLNAEGTAEVKVAAFNVLNYFTTLGDADDDGTSEDGCVPYRDRDGDGNNVNTGCDQRGAWDTEDLQRQEEKIVAAINALDADVVGLMEIENSAKLGEEADEATESLVAALNADAGAGTWAANPSSAALPAVEHQDVITNAIIYKPAKVSRVGDSLALGDQSGPGEAFNNAREPLGQVFRPADGGEEFLFVVNHFKSKGSGSDDGTGQGNANPDRIAQAQALATWVGQVQADTGVEAVLLGGDFNAYTMEDPLQVLYEAGYVDATTEFGGDEWSYSFSGLSGSLDHILLNGAARDLATGSDIWNINAGEALLLEYSRWNYHATKFHAADPYRSSDHDPVLVGLDLGAAVPEKVAATVKAEVKPKKVKAKKTVAKVKVTVTAKGVTPTGKVKVKANGKTRTVKLNKAGKVTVKIGKFATKGKKKVVITYLGDDAVKKQRKTIKVKVTT